MHILKRKALVSQKLRDSAKGKACTLRLDGCLPGNDTVVLAHLPCGCKGMGMKSPDFMAIFSCANCHRQLDEGNRNDIPASDLLRALRETQEQWVADGLMAIKGAK